MDECHVSIFGNSFVGKSAMTNMLMHGYFIEEHSSIEDSYRVTLEVDAQKEILRIMDPLNDCNNESRAFIARNAKGLILMYAINDRASFEQIEVIYQEVLRIKEMQSFPVVICGNKCDLENERIVSKSEGEELAERLHVNFFETSVKSNVNVNEAFSALVREIRKATPASEKRHSKFTSKKGNRQERCLVQ